MGNILYFYLAVAVLVCYFFRSYCQDPELEEEEREKEDKSRDLYEQRLIDNQLAL